MAANNEKVKRKLSKKSKNKIENQPFYDSDEEIGWGRKLTLKEVKARLNKPQCLSLDARDRRSTPCLKQTNFVSSEIKLTENQMEHINKDDSIPAISEYLTASEEANEVENSVCTSNYLSLVEPNVTNNDKSSVYLSTIDIERTKDNLVDTCLNFVQKALDATVDGIENEYHTLETTVNSSIESTDSSISTSKNDLVILISSEEDEIESQDLSFEMNRQPLSCVTEECEEKSSSFSSEKKYTAEDDACDSVENYSRNAKNFITDEGKYLQPLICVTEEYEEKNISSEKKYTAGDDACDSVENYSINTKNFITDEGTSHGESFFYSRNLSPLSIPAIDLEQFNDLSANPLDTTLDRMNAILGENLSLNESAEYKKEEEAVNGNSSTLPQTCNLISGSFLQTNVSHKFNTYDQHSSPERTYNTPFKTPKTIKLTPKITPTTSKIPITKKSPDFRLPDLPNKPKYLNKSKVNYKDIVSPVRMYIKYSPKPVLQQTVHAKDKPCSKFSPSSRVLEAEHKMNSLAIPNVVYKPSKKQIFALNETTNFPFSLDKMIKKSTVIKHERRPNRPNFEQNETLDPEADLTKSTLSDCCNVSDLGNISILHKKTALRK